MEAIGAAKTEEREQQAINTLTLLKSCLRHNEIKEAREHFYQLGMKYKSEAITLFRNTIEKPTESCPECGESLEFVFSDWDLCWRKFHCLKCEHGKLMKEIGRDLPEIMTQRGIPNRFLNASLKDFSKEYTDKIKSQEGLFLFGPRGVGKTHFLAAMMKHEIMQTGLIIGHIDGSVKEPCWMKPLYNMYPVFINVPEFLLKIRGTWNHSKSETSEQEILDKYGSKEILYLDDLGAENVSEWAISTLYLLINRRYESELRTIISSNLSLDEIASNLDDRISSRIAGMCQVIKMEGSDRRLK